MLAPLYILPCLIGCRVAFQSQKMNQLSLEQANQNHQSVGKHFPCSRNQMSMIGLLAPRGGGSNDRSLPGMRMPSHGVSLRSSKPAKSQSSSDLPFPDNQNRFVLVGAESQDTSGLAAGQDPKLDCFNRDLISANQLAEDQSGVTFSDSTQDSQTSQQPHHRNKSFLNPSKENQADPPTISEMISDYQHKFEMKMNRHGSGGHDHDWSNGNNTTISLTSALRSRAIAIRPNKTTDPNDGEEVNTHQSEIIYDQATWRMYNRIVDHRKNQLEARPLQHQAVHATSDNFQTLRSLQTINDLNFDSTDSDATNCPADDGEIFELDL